MPRSNRCVISMLSATLLVGAIPVAKANLITNGSFEAPVVAPGTFTVFHVGSTAIPGFTVVGPAGKDVIVVSGSFTQNGISFPAEDGAQWLDLTGDVSNSTEGVAETIATIVGDRYQLSYFIGNTTGGRGFGPVSTVNVLENGVPTFTDVNSSADATSLTYERFTHVITAASASTTLTFLNGAPPNDFVDAIDNVVLIDLGRAPVPEPASIALLGVGLLGLGLLRRRTDATARP